MPSFGASPINSGGALSQSMAQGLSAPMQTSPQSVSFQPGLQAPQNPPMPDKTPMAMSPHLKAALARRGMPMPGALPAPVSPQGMPQQGMQQPQMPQSESDLIIKALDSRLKHITKKEAHESYAAPHLSA